ncbi:MAG TPA: hypothetical protein VH598_02840, partial [Verrucomicrobiae bacterium]|nr:hypothetical protein [Verrucomicrobiae bacterium]
LTAFKTPSRAYYFDAASKGLEGTVALRFGHFLVGRVPPHGVSRQLLPNQKPACRAEASERRRETPVKAEPGQIRQNQAESEVQKTINQKQETQLVRFCGETRANESK